jgi:peptidoglycan hydrolase-like protein with peptidoglycan-binding domain
MGRDLHQGDSGADVRQLQRNLYQLGYTEIEHASGEYDDATVRALARFDSARGLDPDGTVCSEVQQETIQMLAGEDIGPKQDPDDPSRDRGAADGYTRVWMSKQDFIDYSDSDFDAAFVDNASGFSIQPEAFALDRIDDEPLNLTYPSGATYTVQLGLIGSADQLAEKYMLQGSVIVPVTNDFTVSLDQFHVPKLYLLRNEIHEAIRQAIADDLEMAWIVYAFTQVGTIASGGGDPDLAQRVHDAAKQAGDLESQRQ